MTSSPHLSLTPLCVALALGGCMGGFGPGLADSGLTIATPTEGAYVGSRSVRVAGTSLTETVVVNGAEVAVLDGHWSTSIPASGEGPLTVVVEALNETHRREVVVDSIPPELVLDAESASGFMVGDTLRVSGRVVDDSEVTLTADGAPLTLGPDGRFELSRTVDPGAHRVRISARDRAGHVVTAPVAAIVGDLTPYDAPVEDAAALTLGAQAFDEINVGLNDIVNSETFRQSLRDELIGSYGDVSVRQVEFSRAEITLAPNDGGVQAHALIHDVYVNARACFRAIVRICKTAHVRVETLEVHADVAVAAQDGQLVTTARGATVQAHGFSYNVSGVPGFIEGLFRGRIRREIESAGSGGISDMLSDELPRLLRDASLDAAVPVLGTQLGLLGSFREVALDPTGMHVRLDLEAWAEAPFEDRMAYGYLRLPHGGLTRTDAPSVSAQVSLDTLNAVTFATWSGFSSYDAGVLPGLSGDLTVEELAIATQSRRSLGELAPSTTPVAGAIAMGLPPVVTMETLDGGLRITAPDVRIRLAARLDDGDVEMDVPLVTLSVFVSAPVQLRADAAGALVFDVGELTITADAIDAPRGFLSSEELDEVLRDLAPMLTAGLLEIDGLEVPSLLGFELSEPQATAADNRVRFDATLRYAGGGALAL